MLTGIVKLAQIDDYISPSQNCIQPKIMKKDVKEEKATVTLNDCLACSGCITSAETILIQQMSIQKLMEMGEQDGMVAVMVSPQSLLSLGKFYGVGVEDCLERLQKFFTTKFKTIKKLFQMTPAIQLCHQLILQQFLQSHQNKSSPILCSQCPGWVCYAQKTLTQKVTNLMSKIKSPQQIMSQLIRNQFGKQCRVVSVMPCFDKKLEAIRFEDGGKREVDLVLGTVEVVELVKKMGAQEMFKKQSMIETMIEQNKQPNKPLKFVKDPTSNGYIQFLLSTLSTPYTKTQPKTDYIEYTFTWHQTEYKMAKCYGFRNIQKIVQLIKKDKCPYIYVEIMACPGGCFGGGGQVRYEGMKGREVIGEFGEVLGGFGVVDGRVGVEEFGIDLGKVRVQYKPIEKTLTQAVLNW